MAQPTILAFAGSARAESFNRRLVSAACQIARQAGAEVTEINLGDYPLPLYDQDLQAAEGLPENARRLKQLFFEHDALLLGCPEYNTSITPLLKNAIDWVSRSESPDEPRLRAFEGKIACLLGASPGGFGGLRGLRHVREILSGIGVLVVPGQYALGKAHAAFDDAGNLVDPKQAASLQACVEQFVASARKHAAK